MNDVNIPNDAADGEPDEWWQEPDDDRPPRRWHRCEVDDFAHEVARAARVLAGELAPLLRARAEGPLDGTGFEPIGVSWSRAGIELAGLEVLEAVSLRVAGTARWAGAPALLVAQVDAVEDCYGLEEALRRLGPTLTVFPRAEPDDVEQVLLDDQLGKQVRHRLPERSALETRGRA